MATIFHSYGIFKNNQNIFYLNVAANVRCHLKLEVEKVTDYMIFKAAWKTVCCLNWPVKTFPTPWDNITSQKLTHPFTFTAPAHKTTLRQHCESGKHRSRLQDCPEARSPGRNRLTHTVPTYKTALNQDCQSGTHMPVHTHTQSPLTRLLWGKIVMNTHTDTISTYKIALRQVLVMKTYTQ